MTDFASLCHLGHGRRRIVIADQIAEFAIVFLFVFNYLTQYLDARLVA